MGRRAACGYRQETQVEGAWVAAPQVPRPGAGTAALDGDPHLARGAAPVDVQSDVVGAGPVGLFLGLKIAQQGIKTIVIDKEAEIIKSPRATAYRSIVHSNLVTFPSS